MNGNDEPVLVYATLSFDDPPQQFSRQLDDLDKRLERWARRDAYQAQVEKRPMRDPFTEPTTLLDRWLDALGWMG